MSYIALRTANVHDVHDCTICTIAVVLRSRQAAWVAVALTVILCVGSKICGCECGIIMTYNFLNDISIQFHTYSISLRAT